MSAASILVVDDEPQIRRVLRTTLSFRGYELVEASSGEEALEIAKKTKPSLILLDVNLPGISGIETCRELRRFTAAPIIMLTVRSAERDKVVALDAGADDYVTKPFAIGELLARLRAALRRSSVGSEPVIEFGDVRLDVEKQSVEVSGRHLHLTPHEFAILRLLATNPGKLLTHRTILREVWGPAYGDESNYLHVYVSQLRRKIEPDPSSPRHLLTEPGAGYRLVIGP
jgi:two-component system, OmpR family, KDP operon response regulator KdpE